MKYYLSRIAPMAALTLALAYVPADKKPSTIITLQKCELTPSTRIHATPRIRDREGTASNWGGYAVQTSLASPQRNAVSAAHGTWRIPSVSASASPETYSAIWVGID